MPFLPLDLWSSPMGLNEILDATVIAAEPRKLSVMVIILVVSLFAVSFPAVSKHAKYVRIPGIVFFIGKHFGTGVILATAFIHLLDDAFRSLHSDKVREKYGKVGKWTGSIILGSLLSIFLVEYISTSYVEYLNDQPSAPSDAVGSIPSSVSLLTKRKRKHNQSHTTTRLTSGIEIDENSPLLVSAHLSRSSTLRHPRHSHLYSQTVPIEVIAGSPRLCRLSMASLSGLAQDSSDSDSQSPEQSDLDEQGGSSSRDEEPESHHHHHHHHHSSVGRRRQVIGILVLQLGIMIHSLVIGLTLVVTSGADFTSLTTAIIFHQLFEGLSLGIRIAALPAASKGETHSHAHGHRHAELRQRVTSKVWVKQAAKAVSKIQWLKPTLAVLFGLTTPGGMLLGMALWDTRDSAKRDESQMLLTQGIMSAISAGLLIYAATVEMIAGDFVFGDVEGGHHHHHSHQDEEELEHEHKHPHERPTQPQDSDAEDDVDQASHGGLRSSGSLTGGGSEEGHSSVSEPPSKKSSIGKRVLALLSLFSGTAMMIIIALAE